MSPREFLRISATRSVHEGPNVIPTAFSHSGARSESWHKICLADFWSAGLLVCGLAASVWGQSYATITVAQSKVDPLDDRDSICALALTF